MFSKMNTSTIDLQNYNSRLKSFKNWKSPKSYVELASAGFRYTCESDRVKCDHCGTRITTWKASDNALQCHARISPNCQFLKKIGYRPGPHIAKYLQYSQFSERIASMSSIPKEFIYRIPPIEKIAEAGFFFLGTFDRMACYHCGLILRDWETTTDPITVHKQFRSDCYFIIIIASAKTSPVKSKLEASNTHMLVLSAENHQATKRNEESFTSRLSKLLLKQESKPIVKTETHLNDDVPNILQTTDKLKTTQYQTSKNERINSLTNNRMINVMDCTSKMEVKNKQTHNLISAAHNSIWSKKYSSKHDLGHHLLDVDGEDVTDSNIAQAKITISQKDVTDSNVARHKQKSRSDKKKIIKSKEIKTKHDGIKRYDLHVPQLSKLQMNTNKPSKLPSIMDPLEEYDDTLTIASDDQTDNSSHVFDNITMPSDDLLSLQVNSYSSGYCSFISDTPSNINSQDYLTENSRFQVTDQSSTQNNLPPIYHGQDFAQLPMVKAVMQVANVRYDTVVDAVSMRYRNSQDCFPDALSLLSSIIDSEGDQPNSQTQHN